MTVAYDLTDRGSLPLTTNTGAALEDRFEVLKNIGDGSFGSVVLARVRSAGSNVARRGTIVGLYLKSGIYGADFFF
jgi:meiosis induction protein kinase IME2/SME1